MLAGFITVTRIIALWVGPYKRGNKTLPNILLISDGCRLEIVFLLSVSFLICFFILFISLVKKYQQLITSGMTVACVAVLCFLRIAAPISFGDCG